MNITTVLAEKKEKAIVLKKKLGLLLKYKPLGLIRLDSADLTNDLIEWLKSLDTGFVVYSKWVETEILSKNVVITGNLDNDVISGFDFVVCDDNIENINLYIEKWITPIINKDNHLTSILKEFNPIKNEGNSFFYDELNKWSIFYSIVRYLENYKFPFDNKNLVKNVLKV